MKISDSWEFENDEKQDPDELLLTNTFNNSHPAQTTGIPTRRNYGLTRKIKWLDQSTGDKTKIISLEIPRYQDIHFEKTIKPSTKEANGILKVMKEFKKEFKIRRSGKRRFFQKCLLTKESRFGKGNKKGKLKVYSERRERVSRREIPEQ